MMAIRCCTFMVIMMLMILFCRVEGGCLFKGRGNFHSFLCKLVNQILGYLFLRVVCKYQALVHWSG